MAIGAQRSPYSPAQMEALAALCDTLLPSIDVSDDHPSVVQFFQTSASMAGTPERVAEVLGRKVKHPKLYLVRVVLWLLSWWPGTFILCGWKSLSSEFPYFLRFSEVSFDKREQILKSWCNSYIFLLRLLYTATKVFTLLVYFSQVDEKNENTSWKAIGYCRPDPGQSTRKPKTNNIQEPTEDDARRGDSYGPLYRGIINLNKERENALHKLQALGFAISTKSDGNRRVESLNPSFIIKCDAVVVGSGSGGGVVAGVLAKAGYKVLVLEKGRYFARSNLTLIEEQAMDQMYLGGGLIGTNNMNMLLLAGSTVGGGSTINWSASIRTPHHVTKEWSEKYKLELFDSKAYEHALDVVCQKMGVQAEFDNEGFNNMVLRKGCENLGYPIENIPRNAPSDHYCGWCNFGCTEGKKKGTSETWLVDMVESGNGVVLPEGEALKVITDKRKGRKKALGVAFAFRNDQGAREIAIVESKVTIAAGGAICTPPLLKWSGLKNRNIGKNLHLHPVILGWGYFSDSNVWPEAEKRSYEGGIMTAMSKAVPDSGYGVVIQTPSMHPGMFSCVMPWHSGQDIKNRMTKFSRTAHLFALARDIGSGTVASESNISYNLEAYDEENLSKGIEKVLRILASAGADEIGTHHSNGRVLRVKEAGEKEFERFVKEESSRTLKNLSTHLCSAHQMGSCRMGTDPERSAVRPTGETWEVEGLFVADSSVFPTALGVNPMVTVQAIAYCTAQSVLEVLGRKKMV